MKILTSRAPLGVGLLAAAVLAACGNDEPDAYGNFEANEVIVSAEVGGRILQFESYEGAHLGARAVAGLIDTTTLALQRQELFTQRAASFARASEAQAQTAVIEEQLRTALDDYQRTERLFSAQAATAEQMSRADGQVRMLREQIRAAQAQTGVVHEEASSVQARIEQVDEEIRKSWIINPAPGTVLTTYVEPGEFVQPGQPLYKVAELDTMTLRAYVAGSQLANVRLGERVQVQFDVGEHERAVLPGRVSWISPEAEFTPTAIQTRDERTDQVYAVKIRVPNPDGVLKIGMPAEVLFSDPPPVVDELVDRDGGSRPTDEESRP